jgi:hypothetical protein
VKLREETETHLGTIIVVPIDRRRDGRTRLARASSRLLGRLVVLRVLNDGSPRSVAARVRVAAVLDGRDRCLLELDRSSPDALLPRSPKVVVVRVDGLQTR